MTITARSGRTSLRLPLLAASAVVAISATASLVTGGNQASTSAASSTRSDEARQSPSARLNNASLPSSVVKMAQDEKAAPSTDRVDVVATLASLRSGQVVAYQARGGGECAAVVAVVDTQALCRASLRAELAKTSIVIAAVGPKNEISDDGGVQNKLEDAFAWGVVGPSVTSVRFVQANRPPVAVETEGAERWQGMRFFVAAVDLGTPTDIELYDASGARVSTTVW